METEQLQFMCDIGILNPRADEFTAYLLWGKVIADPVLWKMKVAACNDPEIQALPPGDPRASLYNRLTAQEKIELRDRVFATCGNAKA